MCRVYEGQGRRYVRLCYYFADAGLRGARVYFDGDPPLKWYAHGDRNRRRHYSGPLSAATWEEPAMSASRSYAPRQPGRQPVRKVEDDGS